MSYSNNCLILANVFFSMLGGLLCFIGNVVQSIVNEDFSQYSIYISIPMDLVIAFGAWLIATSLLGLLSIGCRSPVLLFVYIVSMVILFIVEISVAAAVFRSKPRMLGLVKESMRTSEMLYTSERSTSASWDSIQQLLHCCGMDRHEEWFKYFRYPSLPDSCCVQQSKGCGSNVVLTGRFYRSGCYVALLRWVRSYTIASVILLVFVVIFQILSFLCARNFFLDIIESDIKSMRRRIG